MLKLDESIAIKVENLSKVYQLRQPRLSESGDMTSEHWALKDVSFEIKKGESIGIIGPNGSGKSTLLQILAGITRPTSGSVQIRGRVASILDIGAGFHPELSGRENVYLNGQIHGFTKNEIQNKFADILAFSGIEKFIDEPVKNYSQGMYLRLAFSIMAHLDFDIYLFDEVLSVGDAEFREKCNAFFISERNQFKTFIIANHNIVDLAKLECKIIMITKGEYNEDEETTLDSYLMDHLPVLEKLKKYNYSFVKTHEKSLDYISFTINNITINGDNKKKVYLQDVVNIDYYVSIKESGKYLFLLRCYDITGCYLFSHHTNMETSFDAKDFKISFEIPSFTFNTNIYYFDLFVIVNKQQSIKILKSLLLKIFSKVKPTTLEQIEVNKSLLKLRIKDEINLLK